MNFFKSFFGGSKQNETPQPESNKRPESLTPLFELVKGIGQPDKPLLRKGYETSMPCYDFSLWLIEKYRQGDYKSIWEFKNEYRDDDESGGVSFNLEKIFPQYFGPDMLIREYGLSPSEAKKQWNKINDESNDQPNDQSEPRIAWKSGHHPKTGKRSSGSDEPVKGSSERTLHVRVFDSKDRNACANEDEGEKSSNRNQFSH